MYFSFSCVALLSCRSNNFLPLYTFLFFCIPFHVFLIIPPLPPPFWCIHSVLELLLHDYYRWMIYSVFFYELLHIWTSVSIELNKNVRLMQNGSKVTQSCINCLVVCGKLMGYNYVCNSYHHWSPPVTHKSSAMLYGNQPRTSSLFKTAAVCVNNWTLLWIPIICTHSRRISGDIPVLMSHIRAPL